MGGTSIVPSGKIMPVYYQYYVGGQGTVRGITDNKYYGRYFAIGNFEYRFPFIRGTRGALFTDIGDAWGGNTDWPDFKLHAGVGMGIMLNTPFGPVRVDGAYSSNHFKGYFGMGNPF
jgi:outer membrane protein insertion porin family